MSKRIAPGKWDPWLRMAAKGWAKGVGVALILFGLVAGNRIADAILGDGNVGTMELALFGVVAGLPVAVGCPAVFPDILTPLAYRWLDEIDRKRQGLPTDPDDETA